MPSTSKPPTTEAFGNVWDPALPGRLSSPGGTQASKGTNLFLAWPNSEVSLFSHSVHGVGGKPFVLNRASRSDKSFAAILSSRNPASAADLQFNPMAMEERLALRTDEQGVKFGLPIPPNDVQSLTVKVGRTGGSKSDAPWSRDGLSYLSYLPATQGFERKWSPWPCSGTITKVTDWEDKEHTVKKHVPVELEHTIKWTIDGSLIPSQHPETKDWLLSQVDMVRPLILVPYTS